jgi:hypothetical protein
LIEIEGGMSLLDFVGLKLKHEEVLGIKGPMESIRQLSQFSKDKY